MWIKWKGKKFLYQRVLSPGGLYQGEFTPTPQKPNVAEMKDNVLEFCRKLRLAEQFFEEEENNDKPLVKSKKDYQPPKCKNAALD